MAFRPNKTIGRSVFWIIVPVKNLNQMKKGGLLKGQDEVSSSIFCLPKYPGSTPLIGAILCLLYST